VFPPARSIFLALLSLGGACRTPEGALTRWYARPPDLVSRVAAQMLLELGFSIESDRHRDQGAEIVARGPAPERRTLVARFTLEESEQTSVHLDLDRRDRLQGERLLDRISVGVGQEIARQPPVFRSSLEGTYDGTLDDALDAVDLTLANVGAAVTGQLVQPNGARVEARTPDDTVFALSVLAERDTFRIEFTASADDQERANRRVSELKSQFSQTRTTLR
jgi:hypothetical protein